MIQYKTSDRLDELPIQKQGSVDSTEYAKLVPFLPTHINKDNHVLSKKYGIIAVLFIILSTSIIDKLVVATIPTIAPFPYIITILKVVIFVLTIYFMDQQ